MKRMMTAGILALSLCALAEQNASAWVNHKFGIGLNWNWQSGGNNFLWGLFRNGQPPGPGCDAGGCPGGFGGPGCLPGAFPGGGYPGAGGGHFPGFVPPGNIYGPQDFQYFGKQQQQQQPGTAATSQADQGAAQGVSNQLYRTSSYSSYGYGYYPYANYYYGNYYNPYSYGANR